MDLDYRLFEDFCVYESDRLLFRNFVKEDAGDLFLLRSNKEVMRYVDTRMHESVQESESMIEAINRDYEQKIGITWAMINKETNKFAGYYSYWRIIPHHCRAEVGYMIMPEYWNKGYMTETMKKMIPVAFNDMNLHSIEANVNPSNEASKKLLEKMGFRKEAYFRENYLFNGKFLDSLVYSLLKSDCSWF